MKKHRSKGSSARRKSGWKILWVLLLLCVTGAIAVWLFVPEPGSAAKTPLKQAGRPAEIARGPSPETGNPAKPVAQPAAQPAKVSPTPAQVLTPAPAVAGAEKKKIPPKPGPTGAARTEPPPARFPSMKIGPGPYPRPVISILELQIALARQGISCGSIDGAMGSQTRAAIGAFQSVQGLPATGEPDERTRELLMLASAPLTDWIVAEEDLGELQPLESTWLGKSRQSALAHETLLEMVAEKSRAHPNLIIKLNPTINFRLAIRPGTRLVVPDAAMPEIRKDAAFIRIYLSQRLLRVFDGESNLVAHFPCSIAQKAEKRPEGKLEVLAIAPNPNYTLDPAVFTESEEVRSLNRKLILPPGPNNPVGLAWISLSKPGYGIHGTPVPEQVGRTESHGCFRLANWNAMHLINIVKIGMPVYVE